MSLYINKSLIIKETNSLMKTNDRFMCTTLPRLCEKTIVLSMLNAYYLKGCDSLYLKHLNKHNVIWIDMASLYTKIDDKMKFVKKFRKRNYMKKH